MAPKIYHLHPLVAGDLSDWPAHFARVAAMGFDTVCVAPPFMPGASGDIFVTADFEALHPALGWPGPADAGIAVMTREAERQGLRIWLDLAIDRVAIDAAIRHREEQWFAPGGCGALPSPLQPPHRLDVAYARLQQTEIAASIAGWWLERLRRLVRAGVAGFRCLVPDEAPASLWRQILGPLKQQQCRFLAWTPDVERTALPRLEGIGFDHVCCSLAWWDGHAGWLMEEIELLRRIAPVIASSEPSFFDRRAARLPIGSELPRNTDSPCVWPPLRRADCSCRWVSSTACAVAWTPYWRDRRTSARPRCGAVRPVGGVAAANALVDRVAARKVDAATRQLTGEHEPLTALLRTDASDPRAASRALLVLANPDSVRSVPVDLPISPLPQWAGAPFAPEEPADGAMLSPGEVRVLGYARTQPVIHPVVPRQGLEAVAACRCAIAIEAILPRVPDGALAVKRLVGERGHGQRRYHRRRP